MKFYQPQIQLAREQVLNAPDAFYAHIVTFCAKTNFRANGYTVDDRDLQNGNYKIDIMLLQDSNLPEFDYITPVVHTISLGSIAFPGGEGWITVTVLGDVPADRGNTRDVDPPKSETKTGGSGTVSTTSSDDKSRGFDLNSL